LLESNTNWAFGADSTALSCGFQVTIAVVAGVALVGLLVSAFLRDELYAGSRLHLRGEHRALQALTEAGPA